MLTIITGESGSGKTQKLLGLLDNSRAAGFSVSGIICPAVFDGGKKTGIDALLLPGEERIRLADAGAGAHGLSWAFSDTAMEAVNAYFDALCEPAAAERATVTVIDEIGPLELVHGGGFTSALKLLDDIAYNDAIIVVRPSLLDVACKRWAVDAIDTL
ncbi:MAG: hypothetical protein LBM21_01400 [Coriobacteriales bacterium]|jgi:nucleoside-triphosphatase THEP1|nr:hypothetical protein [Coriobacteriales bacterium]